jgi:translocation and assembly module TamB
LVELEDNPEVRVLQPLREPDNRTEAEGKLVPWRIEFDIGRNVRVLRNDLDVPLGGNPVIELAEETLMSGEIMLKPGGRVQLMGKSFMIEGGRIRFVNEDPANPALSVTASWQAPQHLVYVEVRGTVKDPIITFRSDPPLPQPEVVAVLLGGTGETGAALAVGRGLGASIFNQLFSDTPLGTVEIRTAETETGMGKYTAAIQVSNEVWVEANYYQPQRNRGGALDASEQRIGVSGTVDWRFHKNWSLRTELGDIGAGADLLWQYRY